MWKVVVISLAAFFACVAQLLRKTGPQKKYERKGESKRSQPLSADKQTREVDTNARIDVEKNNAAFSLNAISDVFSTYHVDIRGAWSFGILLRINITTQKYII